MTSIPAAKALRFRDLHEQPRAFVIANAWDAGAVRVLAGLGFEAIATSSGAAAGTLGRRDGQISRKEALNQARTIVESTDLPVSADLEKGFADAPEDVAITIRLAGETGLAGCSIEDSTGDPHHPLFDIGLATERIAAAAQAARSLPSPFVLTARSENFLAGYPDLDDTIRRLQAYEKAGADVLFAPGLPSLDAVRTLCASVTKPVNFMVGIKGRSFTVPELEAAGVKRISLATSLYRAAMTGLLEAAREIREHGTFNYVDKAMTTTELNGYMRVPIAD
jgi:2-methylisocitrate lyase-like PEP mutase family enzyme